jgi:ELP3 family radical SAM enzyme/protein acetyltransferase
MSTDIEFFGVNGGNKTIDPNRYNKVLIKNASVRDTTRTLFEITQGSKHLKLNRIPVITEDERKCITRLVEILLSTHDKGTYLSNTMKDRTCGTHFKEERGNGENDSLGDNKKVKILISQLCKEYNVKKNPRFAHIGYVIRTLIDDGLINYKQYHILTLYLRAKRVRSESGILENAIMTSPGNFSCHYNCYYCPNPPDGVRSYPRNGPSALRAAQNGYDIVRQFNDRASTYAINLHDVDKMEIILLGGTWDSYGVDYHYKTITEVYYAANTFYDVGTTLRAMLSLEEEKKVNETALCKIVGITIETHPGQINVEQLIRCLQFGVTRIQIGIQTHKNSILKKINRGCTIEDVYEACYLIKEANIKLQTHWMPNLPGSNPDIDKEMFDELNYNPLLASDDIKIYPTVITKTADGDDEGIDTIIEQWHRDGKYEPYSNEQVKEVLIYGKSHIKEYVRISRVFRDIPKPNILNDDAEPNMRQIIKNMMDKEKLECACIRCHEVKGRVVNPNDITIRVYEFEASKSIEYFISAVSYVNNKANGNNNYRIVHGFIRLRIPHIKDNHFIKELNGCALIREVHVYGEMIPTFHLAGINDDDLDYVRSLGNNQHRGIGKSLVKKAEELALENGFNKLAIISGVGVRGYYQTQGYELKGAYMIKGILSRKERIFRTLKPFWIVMAISIIIAIYLKIIMFL